MSRAEQKTAVWMVLPAAIWEWVGLENVAELRAADWRLLAEGWWWWWWWGGVTLMELRLSCSNSVSLSEKASEPGLTSSSFWRWPRTETTGSHHDCSASELERSQPKLCRRGDMWNLTGITPTGMMLQEHFSVRNQLSVLLLLSVWWWAHTGIWLSSCLVGSVPPSVVLAALQSHDTGLQLQWLPPSGGSEHVCIYTACAGE